MEKQLIEKVLKTNNEACPPLLYQNPVLDPIVASALSKSFVKILNVSKQNSNINCNLRLSVLENVRRLCQVDTENHLKIDENFTELLTKVYQDNIHNSTAREEDSTDQIIDAFLLKRLKDVDIDSSIKSSVNPEIIQALNNLNVNKEHNLKLPDEIINWDVHSQKCLSVLKNIWINYNTKETTGSLIDDISLKMKRVIETIILENCYNILQNKDIDLEDMLSSENSDNSLLHLVRISSVSPVCFQIGCSILNHILLTTNFHKSILSFISTFVNYVKFHSPSVSISTLYPSHLCNLVLLLDIDLNSFSETIRKHYIGITLENLNTLHKESEHDLLLLLSHFPDWFDVYFEHK